MRLTSPPDPIQILPSRPTRTLVIPSSPALRPHQAHTLALPCQAERHRVHQVVGLLSLLPPRIREMPELLRTAEPFRHTSAEAAPIRQPLQICHHTIPFVRSNRCFNPVL